MREYLEDLADPLNFRKLRCCEDFCEPYRVMRKSTLLTNKFIYGLFTTI